GDQLANLVLRLPAEAAVEGALAVRTAEFGHILVHEPRRQPEVGRQGIRPRNVAPEALISIASTLIAPACSRLKGQGCQHATILRREVAEGHPRRVPLRSHFRRRFPRPSPEARRSCRRSRTWALPRRRRTCPGPSPSRCR